METQHVKKDLLEWICPNCQTVNTVDGKPDIVTCTDCDVNQLAYTMEFKKKD
jgi:phage FluMu protein Com